MKKTKFSYSRLSTFIQCPSKYKLKYIDGNYEQVDAIHLELGNILHKALEVKYRDIIDGKPVDYAELKSIIEQGVSEETEKDKGKFLNGIKQIKQKYGIQLFSEINIKSNLSYDDKMTTFLDYLEHDDIGEGWKPIAVEQPFNFSFDEKVNFGGFIDRIDQNQNGDLRVVDYKSSNKIYGDKDLTTPLQMVIYALACENIFGKVPIEFQYDMVLLGEKQNACTKGYYNRGVKKITKVLADIRECEETGVWKPKPTPLCHWCDYCPTNAAMPFYFEGLCDYYSLWTPENKTFEKNKEFMEELDF